MNDYISRGDALAVVMYNPNPVEGIKELPAADLVEVVRCKDCRWSGGVWMGKLGNCAINIRYVMADGFCSEGRRKKDD